MPTPIAVISFVLPARNEESLISATLAAIHSAARTVGKSYEIIVVDDASDDATARIATEHGAQVVPVELHNIGAVRNAGAAVATGEVLFFLDADTHLPSATLAAALRELEQGAIGGGAAVQLEPGVTRRQQLVTRIFTYYWQHLRGWAAGCNIFVLRDVFNAVGGFDEKYFAAEERYLSDALKQQGRFVILKEPVITSARKLRIYSTRHLMKVAIQALILKRVKLTSPQGLEILYDAPRESTRNSVAQPEHEV